MKKLLACMILAMSMSACVTVLADDFVDYNYDGNNSIENKTEGYKTVLIAKAGEELSSESIVYVDQAENGFVSAADFLLKENPAPGYYTVTYGTDDLNAPAKKASFVIGNGLTIQTADKMTFITEENVADYTFEDSNGKTYKRAYHLTTGLERYQSYNSVKLVYNDADKTKSDDDFTLMGAYPKSLLFEDESTLTGEGDVFIIVQFHGMSEQDYAGASNWDVFFSTDTVTAVDNK